MNIIYERYTNTHTLVSMCINAHSLGVRYFEHKRKPE